MEDTNFKLITPVVIVMFNRPNHLRKVFEQVRIAKPSKLFVIADGPRDNQVDDIEKCEECKKIIEEVDWPCEVLKNYSIVNLGCGRRPATGLDWVFKQVEEAIILEDDCVPEQSFFKFCQELLEKYRHDDRIISISGNNYQNNNNICGNDSYYFSIFTQTWGWATWRRVWENYDFSMNLWPEFKQSKQLYGIFKEKDFADSWDRIFQDVYSGKIDSAWDYQFLFLSFIRNGLNILPKVNLVAYIGFDEMATHTFDANCKLSNIISKSTEIKFPLKHPNIVQRNYNADRNDMSVVFDYKSSIFISIKKIIKCFLKRNH